MALRTLKLIALTIALTFAAHAQPGSPTAPVVLELTIVDASGAGVAAQCTLDQPGSERISQTATGAGRVSFSNLPPGDYRLSVSREGFAPVALPLRLTAGRVSRTIQLRVGIVATAVDVVSPTPVPGLTQPAAELSAPVQTLTSQDFDRSQSLDLADLINRRLTAVHVNETQGNPLQPDVNYRGYTASPLLGTPQGLSVYLDGMRMNQPFGDTLSWDLIPAFALAEMALIPGSNPLFGLNTLGGALVLDSKDGRRFPGSSLRLSGGSFGRIQADAENGGSWRSFDWYLAGALLFEDGWRATSDTNARQLFSRLGWQGTRTRASLSLGYANNALLGNGLQEFRLLERDRSSVYTKPDLTANRSPYSSLNVQHAVSSRLTLSGLAYFRHLRTRTLNGDINEESLSESLYQPNLDEQAALRAAGFTGFPTAGESAANAPFPSWRCIANGLLGDEPGEKCNGLLNATATRQNGWGTGGQLQWLTRTGSLAHRITAGAAYDGSRLDFRQGTELGFLNPDRTVTGIGIFADGVNAGTVEDEPLDNRAALAGRIHSGSVYGADTVSLGSRTHLSVAGRYNRTVIDNRDLIRPAAGTGSLTGRHVFERFNPSVGLTVRMRPSVTGFASYAEGSRAPTSIELGCADPESPCRLPNALAGDPPLRQVVTRTVEAGFRSGSEGRWQWRANWFRATNRDDILFVASEQTSFGYFKNFGQTQRDGVEASLTTRWRSIWLRGGYTFLRATFQSPERVNGTGNSTNEEAQEGELGLESSIAIEPGNRIPLVPAHLVRANVQWQATRRLSIDGTVVGVSSSFARGDENNEHQPDGIYYLGSSRIPGYGIVHSGVRYQLGTRWEIFAQCNNLFDRQYATGGQLGPSGFLPDGRFLARPLPPVDDEYPVTQSTFLAPGAPRAAWAGVRVRF